MAQLKIGIQANLIKNPADVNAPRFDKRGTADVDSTRAPKNGKFFRTRQQREIAKSEAKRATKGKYKGTFVHYGDGFQPQVV